MSIKGKLTQKPAELTFRALLIGAIGSMVISTSSLYVALRMGALPWPTIFVAIASMAILRTLGRTTLQEINVAHTAMSGGAMVAGGVAFTLPALWIIDGEPLGYWHIVAVVLGGVLPGLLIAPVLRNRFVVSQDLPFPIGHSAYETITASKGQAGRVLFITMGISGLFTFIRDWFALIPQVVITQVSTLKGRVMLPMGAWVSPMAIGIGYLIGPLYSGVWFLGSIIGFFCIVPLGVAFGLFPDSVVADGFRSSLGIGLMLGTGVGVLLKLLLSLLKQGVHQKSEEKYQFSALSALLILVAAVLVLLPLEIPFFVILIILVGALAMPFVSALLVGQTGINPMEIFGILMLLLVSVLWKTGVQTLVITATITAISCGFAGDILNDYHVGKKLGTNPRAQWVSEWVGAGVSVFIIPLVFLVLLNQFGPFGTATLPAPQAMAVSSMIQGIPSTLGLFSGIGLGTLFYLLKLPSMTFGLGVYLPVYITWTMALGGFIRLITGAKWKNSESTGTIISSGLLGGEAVTGVIVALVRVITGS